MRKRIRIENPIAGVGWTSRNRAKRFIASGRAEWSIVGEVIRFRHSERKLVAIQISAEETERRRGYDGSVESERAEFSAIAGLPVVQPGRLLGFGRVKGATAGTFRSAARGPRGR